MPISLPLYLLIMNVVTALAYALDKFYAKRQQWRIPESTLHILALAGGSPAAFLAQRLFRHKTRKQPFQLYFWMIVVLQIVFLCFFSAQLLAKFDAVH